MKFPTRLQDLVPPDAVKQLLDVVSQPSLVSGFKEAAQKLGFKENWSPTQLQEMMQQAKKWVETVASKMFEDGEGQRPCVNATGEFFSDRFPTRPMSAESIRALAMCFDGFTEGRMEPTFKNYLRAKGGVEEVAVFASLPEALRSLITAARYRKPPSQGTWVLPRMDCVTLPSLQGPLPLLSILESTGADVMEIGASTECSENELDHALSKGCCGVLTVEKADPLLRNQQHRDLVLMVAKRYHVPVCEILLTGSVEPIPNITPQATLVRDRLQAGAEWVVMAADGWLSGPPNGLVMGSHKAMQSVFDFQQASGLLPRAWEIATLNATLSDRMQANGQPVAPILDLMATSIENLTHRAQRIAAQIKSAKYVKDVHLEGRNWPIGHACWSGVTVATPILEIECEGIAAKDLQSLLIKQPHPILTRLEGDRLQLLLRTVPAADDHRIVDAFWPESDS